MIAVLLGVALLAAAALVMAARGGHPGADRAYLVLVVGGCATAGVAALRVLSGAAGGGTFVTLPSAVPGGNWVFGLDALSAFFVVTICLVGAAGIAFGTVYLGEERAHRPVAFAHATFALVLAAMLLVVTAQAVVPFLGAWEMMAVGSYFLIAHEHERPDVRQAGRIYLVATHTGTLLIIAMFAAWGAHAGDWTFAALGKALPGGAGTGALVLVLGLIGFGFKAGFVPLHFWLPPAHGSAPTHVSALMSGIVIKMGVYGVLRVVALLAGAPPAWWGWSVLVLGAVSGVLGVLWALAQHDMKRLLAYHSVENIGIILIGIGVGALGSAYGHPVVAALGYAGAALHTLNHALFKSLLFLGAGLVQRATGTRDIEALGGLAKRMPATWLAFFLGAAAIVGLPPLNGFVSEWLVYLGLFRAAQAGETLRFAAFAAAALGLVGALALACFAKVSGIVFLGTPRTARAAEAGEAPRALLAPLFVLAGACIVLGVFPILGAGPALDVAAAVGGATPGTMAPALPLVRTGQWITVLALSVVLLAAGAWALRRALLRARAVRTSATWGCGFTSATPRMQYTASSFAAPLLSMFGRASGVVTRRGDGTFETHPVDLVLDRAALPAWRRVHRLAVGLRPIQQGRLFVYLLYVMVALVLLLAYLALETSR